MGERNDIKGVLLVDIPKHGVATVTSWEQNASLQLKTTPFYDITTTAADLESLQSLYPNLEGAFVKICLELEPEDDRVFLQRQVRELAKQLKFRLIEVNCLGQGVSRSTSDLSNSPQDYQATVLGYLRNKYSEQPELLAELKTRTIKLID